MNNLKVVTDITASLTGRLSYLNERHEVMSQNLAHLETPGYRAKDLSFEGYMNAEQSESTVSFKAITEVTESEKAPKPNGNNVKMEEEISKLTGNSVEYMTAIEILKKNLALMKTAILESR